MSRDAKNFDISSLSYEDFLLYFFTEPSSDKWDKNADGESYWLSEIKEPRNIVGHLTRMCRGFGLFASSISLETLDNGLNGMLAPAFFELQSAIWANAVPLDERIRCIESMHPVYSDFVSSCRVEVLPGSFYMWWDHICTAFWFEQTYHKKLPAENYRNLSGDDKRIVDAMFETLSRILSLDDDRSKGCALHGLGHLHHPEVANLIQRFMDSLPENSKSPEALNWLQKCRDGVIM